MVDGREYVAFLLRLWNAHPAGKPGDWRASLEDPHSGERKGFASLEALFGYLGQLTNGMTGAGQSEAAQPDEAGPKTRVERRAANLFGVALLLAALLATSFPGASTAKALAPATGAGAGSAPYRVFLPALMGGNGSTPTPPPSGPSSFFLPWMAGVDSQATDGPSLAVDGSGGVHIAYAAYTSDASGNRPAYYVYCPANCASPASFSAPVVFNGRVDHVNLALDGQGHPRIMWEGVDPAGLQLSAYVYLACDANCASAANWQTTRVLGLDTTLPHNSRFFAAGPQGVLGLVYYRDMIGAASGTYFARCAGNCTSAASWQHTQMSTAELQFPVLTFSRTGLPRIAGSFLDLSTDPALRYLVYVECDLNCQTFAQGGSFPIDTCSLCNEPRGYFDLALDSNDHPRMALYTGSLEAGRGLDPKTLYYLFCTAGCGDLALAAWDGYSLGLAAGVGTYVRLALDTQNRPRLAYEDVSYGLQYEWCVSGCEGSGKVWQATLADSSATLDQTEPVPPIPPCQVAGWFTGKRPSLALDPSGNPRIAYDAEHWQGLEPINYPPGSPGCPGFSMDQINARFTIFSQP
jgi:hypothetical protein